MSYILVVDDNRFVNACIAQLLKKEHYEVKTALNGFEALHHIRKDIPGTIICDINMPGMTGYDLLAWIRKTSDLESIPVIMHTDDQDEEKQEKFKKMGIAFYLHKPCSSQELLQAVHISSHGKPT